MYITALCNIRINVSVYLVLVLSSGSAFPVFCKTPKTVIIASGDSFPEREKYFLLIFIYFTMYYITPVLIIIKTL